MGVVVLVLVLVLCMPLPASTLALGAAGRSAQAGCRKRLARATEGAAGDRYSHIIHSSDVVGAVDTADIMRVRPSEIELRRACSSPQATAHPSPLLSLAPTSGPRSRLWCSLARGRRSSGGQNRKRNAGSRVALGSPGASCRPVEFSRNGDISYLQTEICTIHGLWFDTAHRPLYVYPATRGTKSRPTPRINGVEYSTCAGYT
ncbi:hypothetical protein EDC01DRAFT_628987 [Geopyxis carbonaria]|nr:hypothetical protein EDC01DRAFT_628987 [Geopyxis carbonaria]